MKRLLIIAFLFVAVSAYGQQHIASVNWYNFKSSAYYLGQCSESEFREYITDIGETMKLNGRTLYETPKCPKVYFEISRYLTDQINKEDNDVYRIEYIPDIDVQNNNRTAVLLIWFTTKHTIWTFWEAE